MKRGRSSQRRSARSASPVSKLVLTPPAEDTPSRSEPATLYNQWRQKPRRGSRVRFDAAALEQDSKQEESNGEDEESAARAAAAAARAAARKRRYSRGLGGRVIEAPGVRDGLDCSADADGTQGQPCYSVTKGLKGMAYGAGVGALYGTLPAMFTFGLSIPACATVNALRHGYKGFMEPETTPVEPASRDASPVHGRQHTTNVASSFQS